MKKCTKCKQFKSFSEFHKNKNSKDSYAGTCKLCIKNYDIKNYQDNKDKLLNQSKQWQVNNKQIVLNYQKEWYKNNKQNTLEYHSEYRKENKDKIQLLINKWRNKKRKDLSFKMIDNLRNRINKAITKNKGYKSQSTLKLLGCSVEECKQHLEAQFKPEMNWENHGIIWEIDHIKPCDSFDLTDVEQQKQCFHYNNLQPLFKTTKVAESFGYINEVGNRNKSNK